jgi:biofilm PGA synthesis protein PgaD
MSSASDQIHINAPELLTGPERRRDTIFTAVMWAIYLYLWVPLASLFAWLLGFEFAYDIMIRSGGAQDLSGVLIIYGVIVLAIFAMVAFWSLGNLLRYGKLHRRHATGDLSPERMAEYFKIDPEAVEALRSTQSVSIVFDTEGRPKIEPYRVEI